jgi:hypothetical protein
MAPMPQPPGAQTPQAPILPGMPAPLNLPMGSASMNNQAPPFAPSQPAGGYPNWAPPIAPQQPPRDATPTTHDSFDQPMFPNRPSSPHVAGFTNRTRKVALQPWMLVIGALVMAALAFAITRAFIS